MTTGSGSYNAPNLVPGVYRVEVAVSGFRSFVLNNVTVTAGATVREDVQFQLGQLTESMEVKAQAVQLQTEDARVTTPSRTS